jgi:hypothetical protein
MNAFGAMGKRFDYGQHGACVKQRLWQPGISAQPLVFDPSFTHKFAHVKINPLSK